MADPLPGMDIRLLSVLLWSLKKHPPSSPLNSRALDLLCLPSTLLSFSHTFPWPGYCLGGGPLYLVTGGVNVPGKALRWSLDRQGGQAGGRFELLGTLNVVSLQTDTVSSYGSISVKETVLFPQASNFVAVTRSLTLLPPSRSLVEGEEARLEGRGQGLCDLTEGLVDRACPLYEKLSPQWA